jgi:P-type Ca2+ transporter type 2C
MNWFNETIETVYEKLQSSAKGLDTEAINHKLKEFGPNVLVEKKKKPALLLFLLQFKDFMIIVLVVAAVIAGIAGDPTDTIIILVIVILNAILGFIQEYRAEKAMEALKQMATPQALVLRNGHPQTIDSEQLVLGDIVSVEAGNIIPADLRIIEAHAIRINESSLTGESVPVDKFSKPIKETNPGLGDQLNMAFKGTLVTNGRAKAIVVATGMHTELGKIAKMLQEDDVQTPLQRRMRDFGKKLSWIIILICIVLFGVGILRGEKPLSMLLLSISLAVAAIPEALPALITIALSRGANRLVRKKVLIRKLPAVETLGSVTYICSDKTGTLTQNRMKVVEVFPVEKDLPGTGELNILELAMALNHDVKKDKQGMWIGDPTEIAMVDHIFEMQKTSSADLSKHFKRVGEIPFDSERKSMTTIHHFNEKYISISKGAAESILAGLKYDENKDSILEKANAMAANGIRVLAFGFRVFDELPEKLDVENMESNLEFAGLVGMIDPPRVGISNSIMECRQAGIQPVMITGDHKETASAIAREIGILGKDDLVVTGAELNNFELNELKEKVESIKVYARVSPQQKLDIVKALQEKKQFVAMTGDGVNDAPSLKTANIGVAMGITGTDVSKEAAHMILLDDNFASIVNAVREGRRIYDNIRKFVKYIMTCNSAEILTIFMAPLLGLPIPLLPIHILWINLVTDGLPGLALSAEKAEQDIMKRPPRKTDESLFAEGLGYHIIWVGILMAFVTLGTQSWALNSQHGHWQTMVFTVLAFSQLGHVLAIRSDYQSIYKRGLFSNRPLAAAIVFTILLQLGTIYIPFANKIFKTQPLILEELLICFGLSVVIFHAVELEKYIRSRKKKKRQTNESSDIQHT